MATDASAVVRYRSRTRLVVAAIAMPIYAVVVLGLLDGFQHFSAWMLAVAGLPLFVLLVISYGVDLFANGRLEILFLLRRRAISVAEIRSIERTTGRITIRSTHGKVLRLDDSRRAFELVAALVRLNPALDVVGYGTEVFRQ